jgi:hypothetical protein
MIEKYEPAYITIVEGPPPEFQHVSNEWSIGVMEGVEGNEIGMCEMRAFDGPKLVKRCQDAWGKSQPARLDFPTGDGMRDELDIIAIRWETVEEGHKVYLWVKM